MHPKLMHPKFFRVAFVECDTPLLGMLFDENSIYVFDDARKLTQYGISRLNDAYWSCELSAKEFADDYISRMFGFGWQQDCVLSNKVFGLLVDDCRMQGSKGLIKAIVLKGLSEEYALEEKYF